MTSQTQNLIYISMRAGQLASEERIEIPMDDTMFEDTLIQLAKDFHQHEGEYFLEVQDYATRELTARFGVEVRS